MAYEYDEKHRDISQKELSAHEEKYGGKHPSLQTSHKTVRQSIEEKTKELKREMRNDKAFGSGHNSFTNKLKEYESKYGPDQQRFKLTPNQIKTLNDLQTASQSKKDYDKVNQGVLTRIYKKLFGSKNEQMIQDIIPSTLDYEKHVHLNKPNFNAIEYLRKKFTGFDKTMFTNAIKNSKEAVDGATKSFWETYESINSSRPSNDKDLVHGIQPLSSSTAFQGSLSRLDNPVEKPRDIGKIVEYQQQKQQQFQTPQKKQQQQRSISETLIDKFQEGQGKYQQGSKMLEQFKKQTGGDDVGSSLLYYEFPQLKVLDEASKAIGMGWTQEDTDYLHKVLDPRYQGPEKQDFTGRVKWVGKVMANPSKWWDIVKDIGVSEVKNSEIGKWFDKTFNQVKIAFDSDVAKTLRDTFKGTEPPMYKMKLVDDKSEGVNASDNNAPVAGKKWEMDKTPEDTSSKFKGIKSTVMKAPKESDESYLQYRKNLDTVFKKDIGAKPLVASDKVFERAFKEIYKKYHHGLSLDRTNAETIYEGLTNEQEKQFNNDLSKITRDSLIRQNAPVMDYSFKQGSDAGAGDLLDDTGKTLLSKYVDNLDLIDDKIHMFILRGQKLPNDDRNPRDIKKELDIQKQRLLQMMKQKDISKSKLQGVFNDFVRTVPVGDGIKVSQLQESILPDTSTSSSSSTSTAVDTDTAKKQLTQTEEEDKAKKKKKEDDDDKDKDKKYKKPLSEEETFYGKKQKNPELRPKLGFMDQQELEDTLIGTEQQRMETDHTWSVFDLKPINESAESNEQNPEENKVFQRVVDHFNMRYGQTFSMPEAPRETQYPELFRKNMNDIYDASKRMIDAFDNKQFKNINPEARQVPNYEERAIDIFGKLIPITPFQNGVDNYNYKFPQFKEPIKALRNRGKHF